MRWISTGRRGLVGDVDRNIFKRQWADDSIGRDVRELRYFLRESANQCCASDQNVAITTQIGSCRTVCRAPVAWNETKVSVIVERDK